MTHDEAEADFTSQLCDVGILGWCVSTERNFYYCFWMKDGRQRFWTNIRESNLRRILEASGIDAPDNLSDSIHPKRRDVA